MNNETFSSSQWLIALLTPRYHRILVWGDSQSLLPHIRTLVAQGFTLDVIAQHPHADLLQCQDENHSVHIANSFSSEQQLSAYDLVLFADAQNYFPEHLRLTAENLSLPIVSLSGSLSTSLKTLVEPTKTHPKSIGTVYLIGAGPGDPELLTLKAARILRTAEVVIYDRLIPEEILQLAPQSATRVYVGKAQNRHTLPQADINKLLVTYALEGKTVVRVKGGDPMIFGRAGEELAQLQKHQIPFEIIPGVTAASGCAAYTGLTLTHRDHAQSIMLVTGHLQDASMNLNWHAMAQPGQTLVIYMGVTVLPTITHELQAHGMSATTPISLIEKGTTLAQRIISGTLEDIVPKANAANLQPPTLIVIGELAATEARFPWRNA